MKNIKNLYDKYVLPTYGREELTFVKGQGSYLFDDQGKKYLDLYPGWGTGCLGHCHPYMADELKKQLTELIHVPNNYYNIPQAELAQQLAELGFHGLTFFCNSGAEANEAAIKLARKFGSKDGRYEIITFYNSFHGRTLAAVTATGQEKYHKGFAPLPEGFKYVEFGDIDALTSAVSPKTCAVMIEFIQGEGGININNIDYYKKIELLCREQNLLFIADEVQTGIGRTGNYYGFQTFNVSPDVVTLAKALGGGVPIGAMMAKPQYNDILTPGSHASTYGGNPLATRAALAVLEVFKKENIINNVNKQSQYLFNRLKSIKNETSLITDIRGAGLMVGVDITVPASEIKEKCRKKSVLINNIGKNTIRFLPALNISREDLKKGVDVFEEVLKEAEQ